MKVSIKWQVVFAVVLCLAGCGGGGGGASSSVPAVTPPAAPTATAVALKISLAGVNQPMSGVQATVTLPAGTTVATLSGGSVAAGTIQPSGVLAPVNGTAIAALFPNSVSYDASARRLSFILYSTQLEGFGAGEFASIACVVTGAVPAPAAFSAQLVPVDLPGTVLSTTGVSAGFQLVP